ncbi:hypothetical protein TSOC_000128 [Tetrabaena socialis]|uniref:Protein root UVB sensitive/RUS domain-containing protein n=1 Tax=Tetrabaena socialis TaxID=47790 RepID=A0A2J8AK10_9CHLO|nr:hypothetical protein TSOC_000128 [Tetrabaena socialis]|eukprot:PNH12864.1 hypothetical protein TSOC_000128 [Tetrabaena socialis]
MSDTRFALASMTTPLAATEPHGHGLRFSLAPASSHRASLLAFINAPVSVAFLNPHPDAERRDEALQLNPARFPPWKKLPLPPALPKLGAANRHSLVEQGQGPDEGGAVAVESSAGRRRRIYMPRDPASTPHPSLSASPSSTPPASAAASAASAHQQQQQQQQQQHDASHHGFDIVDERQTHEDHLRALVHAYFLPNGFPDSVAPQYAPYMFWRGVQYFFGGAISVFTTQSLLGALGVAGGYRGEAAAAINWVIKDGAGRLGRLLFARWGRELDCELKQFRLAGKGGDAGGPAVLGTQGYLLASRKEVDSVELPYMNRARLAYCSRHYLLDGAVPGVAEANQGEPLLPWGRYNQSRLVLGASVEAACAGSSDLAYSAGLFREGRYLVTYRWEPGGDGGVVAALYPDFLSQAEGRGWKLGQTMLNPRENRILRLAVPLVA